MVIDATKLFCADERPVSPFIPASPFDALFGMKKMKGVFKADLSSILDFKAFPQNISVKSRVAYTVNGTPFTAVVHLSMIQLPDEPMRPRLLDPRMGYFSDRKVLYSTEKDQSEKIAYVNRWRLEPKPEELERYKKGELVEPAKPIVFYVDNALPVISRPMIPISIPTISVIPVSAMRRRRWPMRWDRPGPIPVQVKLFRHRCICITMC